MDLAMISLLAFVVNIAVEVTKGLPLIDRIPTKGWAIIVSALVCFMVLGVSGTVLTVSVICEAILRAVIVAYIAIFGFDTFKSIYDRYMNKE